MSIAHDKTTTPQWSPQQDAALKAVDAWLKDKSGGQVFRLFGFAGSGKTTLAIHLAKGIKQVLFAAFTGKAALVMRRKGCDGASTIHSLIYTLEDESGGEPTFTLNGDSAVRHASLVVVDECSMVGETLAKDLLSFGTRVLVLGDPAQLPPVKDAGYFTECAPDFMLTEIHRQAQENPIIRLSMDVRQGRGLDHGDFGAARVVSRKDIDQREVLTADQVLVGLNRTREMYNHRIRDLLGFAEKSPFPVVGERLICLRNDRAKGLLNGGIWTTKTSRRKKQMIELLLDPEDDGDARKVSVHQAFFQGKENSLEWHERRQSNEFTFGHAITVHKSQGSQFDNVMLFDESGSFREDARRWLYTGITRAAERITIVRG